MRCPVVDVIPFRNALGQFATGVTIVTTAEENGAPVGVTASSFNSVSLDPPLILWSLAKTAQSMPAYQNSGGFNVHVLAAHQSDLSNSFARSNSDKFADVKWTQCDAGFPLLPEYAALFRCKTHFQYEGGDHIIFVGEVTDYISRRTSYFICCLARISKVLTRREKPSKP